MKTKEYVIYNKHGAFAVTAHTIEEAMKLYLDKVNGTVLEGEVIDIKLLREEDTVCGKCEKIKEINKA